MSLKLIISEQCSVSTSGHVTRDTWHVALDHLFLRARPRPPLSSWLLCRSAMARVSHTTTGCRDLATSLGIQIQIRAANEDSWGFHSVRHFNTVGRREIGTLLCKDYNGPATLRVFDNKSTCSYDHLVSVKILRPLAMFKHPFESSMLIGALNKEKALVETFSEHCERRCIK